MEEHIYVGKRVPFGGYPAARLDAKNLEEKVGYFLSQNQPIPTEVFVEYVECFLSDKDAEGFYYDSDELGFKLAVEEERRKALEDRIAERDQELQLLLQELILDQYEGKDIPDEVIEKIAQLVPTQSTDSV